MRFSFGRPFDIAWTLGVHADPGFSLTPGAFLNDASNLTNGVPGLPCIFRWPTGDVDHGYMTLTGEWSTGAVRITDIGLVGISLPAGQIIDVFGKRVGDAGFTYDLGGNSTSQFSYTTPEGDVVCWYALPYTNDPLVGIQFHLYNYFGVGAPTLAGGELVRVCEAWLGDGIFVDHDFAWKQGQTDPSIGDLTINSQDAAEYKTPYRTYSASFTALTREEAYGPTTDPDVCPIVHLRQRLNRLQTCAFIPRWRTADGTGIDQDWLQLTAIVGKAKSMSEIEHQGGDYYKWSFECQQYPVPALPPLEEEVE